MSSNTKNARLVIIVRIKFYRYHESSVRNRIALLENVALGVVILAVIVVLGMIFFYKPF